MPAECSVLRRLQKEEEKRNVSDRRTGESRDKI